jgi:hypothetical protein
MRVLAAWRGLLSSFVRSSSSVQVGSFTANTVSSCGSRVNPDQEPEVFVAVRASAASGILVDLMIKLNEGNPDSLILGETEL